MNKTVPDNISVLLVEDNADDAELTLRVFRQYHFANHIHVVQDGAEALDCLFGEGTYGQRKACEQTKLILLDLKLPKVDGLEVVAGEDLAKGLSRRIAEVAGLSGCCSGNGALARSGFGYQHLFLGECVGQATSLRAYRGGRSHEVHRQLLRYERREES